MKRIIAILVSAIMLLSLGTVFAGASDIFEPAGEVEIAWLTEDQVAQIEFDGNIDEWNNFDLNFKTLDQTNLITWRDMVDGEEKLTFDNPDAIGTDFAINAYFAADADYLYVAFYIDDEHFARSNNSSGDYNGDAFQISIDWNRHMENALEQGVDYQNNKNVFYSFSCGPEDGEELVIRIQEGFKDRDISESTSADPTKPDMRGSTGATENGWCAEFALAWELLYGDFEYKTWDSPIDAFNADSPVTLGMSICYINRAETNGPIVWAAGTFNNDTDYPEWEPTANGLYASLKWAEDREVNCRGIGEVIPPVVDTDTDEVEDTTVEEVEETTTIVAVEDTEAGETTTAAAVVDTTKAEETTAAPAAAGCKAVIASASVLAVVALAAGAVICKKKD